MSEKRGFKASLRTIKTTVLHECGYYKRRYLRQFPNVKDAVFIWIPKNGGTSMYQTLKPLGMRNYSDWNNVKRYFLNRGMVTFIHLNYSFLLESEWIDKSFHESAFKFAISRNPYDRAVSAYFYFKGREWINEQMSFKTFTNHIAKIDSSKNYTSYNFYEGYLFPQLNYITLDRELIVDYIARLENIKEDMNTINKQLGLKAEYPHLNSTNHKPYQDYYCPDSKRNIQKAYAIDFEKLNYSTEL